LNCVTQVTCDAAALRSYPQTIGMDNGPELVSRLVRWEAESRYPVAS
jgi:hypothetical protein